MDPVRSVRLQPDHERGVRLQPDHHARIARARALASETPAAREALTFLAELSAYQLSLFLAINDTAESNGFRDAVDLDAAAAAVPGFIAWLAATAPTPLARSARAMRADQTEWRGLIRDSLSMDDLVVDEPTAFVIDAVAQPFAEAAAAGRLQASTHSTGNTTFSSRCPICAGLPLVGVLREEGQGARRALVCARCLNEWPFARVLCPGCGEERFDALPVFTADSVPHVRIEACDTCRQYLKTIDLTRDGLAVPMVDDIATVTLDLWAVEQGYHRARPNLLRTGEPARTPAEIEQP
jgi:FdhE protein